MQDELVVLQCLPQLVLQRELTCDPVGHLLGIEQVALAGRFCSLERRLGVLEQAVGISAIAGKHRDSEFGGDAELRVAYLIRSAEDLAVLLLNDPRHVILDSYVRNYHCKLVADQPGEQRWICRETRAACGDPLQQLIAGLAAQGVVDGVESLRVQENERQLLLLVRGRTDLLGKTLMEQVSIRHPRQRVVKSEVVEFLPLHDVVKRKSDV